MNKMLTKKIIALADDDIDDREIFSEACDALDSDLEVLLFENGLELITYLNRSDADMPTILFLDINMPVKDGFETLKALKTCSEFDDLKIIMYSTSVVEADVEKAKKLGADRFFQKPFNFGHLSASLQKILETHWQDARQQTEQFNFLITF